MRPTTCTRTLAARALRAGVPAWPSPGPASPEEGDEGAASRALRRLAEGATPPLTGWDRIEAPPPAVGVVIGVVRGREEEVVAALAARAVAALPPPPAEGWVDGGAGEQWRRGAPLRAAWKDAADGAAGEARRRWAGAREAR